LRAGYLNSLVELCCRKYVAIQNFGLTGLGWYEMMRMRSKLFVPGSRPELFQKALQSEADALSFDLEDAVSEERKDEARGYVGKFLETSRDTGKAIIVRTNPVSSAHFEKDIQAIVSAGLDFINIPKVEDPAEIEKAEKLLVSYEQELGLNKPIGILVNIESPKGLRRAGELAWTGRRVAGLQIGYGDLCSPLGIDRREVAAIQHVMFAVRMAAGEAGVMALDGAFTDVADLDGFIAEAELAKRMGFAGKSCIHPTQIDSANLVFRPSEADIAYSLKVLKKLESAEMRGVGAFVVDGQMVDAPLFERANSIIQTARKLGLIE
jgi:citrate lyase beta subunit